VLGETGVKDYLDRSKFSGAGRGGLGGFPEFFDYMAADYTTTIFWGFIPRECYVNFSCLALKLRIAIPAINVFHFFIRKGCTL